MFSGLSEFSLSNDIMGDFILPNDPRLDLESCLINTKKVLSSKSVDDSMRVKAVEFYSPVYVAHALALLSKRLSQESGFCMDFSLMVAKHKISALMQLSKSSDNSTFKMNGISSLVQVCYEKMNALRGS
jgi:hypothetical protein